MRKPIDRHFYAPCLDRISGRSLPVEAQNVDTVDGDFDGDGRRDQMFAYNVAGSPEISRFLVQLATGYTHEFVDDVFFQINPPSFLGTLDVNEDGNDEAFVSYAGGASTFTVRVINFFDCRLATLGEYLVGGSIGQGEGFACRSDGADIVDYAAELSADFNRYIVSWESYRIAGDLLELIDVQEGVEVDMDDPLVTAAYSLNCGNIGL